MREYQIPFAGLKPGLHHFNFELDETFFEHFAESQIHTSRIFADLALDKKERLLVLNFDISGSFETECDRCGQLFNLPIHGNYSMYVKIGDAREEDRDNEEVIWLGEHASMVDITEMLYEFVHLSIPMHRVHPDRPDGTPGCDPAILERLSKKEDNKNDTDPRWNILSKLHKN